MTLPVSQPPERGPVRHDDEVYRVTSAKAPLSADQRKRIKRYLISMGIRTACFLGVIVTTGWVRWALVAAALVLPYIAVVMANAGRENDPFPGPDPIDLRPPGQPITANPVDPGPDTYR